MTRPHLISELMYIDENGQYMDGAGLCLGDGRLLNDEKKANASRVVVFPFFFALSMIHCKNTHLENLPKPRMPRKARKQKNSSDVAYKTLIIDPLRQQARQECDKANRTPVQQALHIVRGHFKDYRDGAGLFGKYKDIYWWEMHARGKEEYGKIEKDYKVLGKRKSMRKKK